ncbi:amino acid ABC transporter permease [Desulfuromonas sp. AOP6]|uniref:amino acid ABC transporter permease n=1 Tax=Desulfuromonas sp. AOP6 TaxID=1566351 RepID=UPI00126E7824|nr:amino acid ABC transporter permease [Desulfuromonas sp. AOP6]BCA80690.1 ABC transporter permease [Desulfuromonas sp. AOP6]
MNSGQDHFYSKLLLAAILILVAAGMWGATARVDYTWRWERVPQYFLYKGDDIHKAGQDGRVESVRVQGESALVQMRYDDGEVEEFTVDSATVKVTPGEELFEGDILGFSSAWHIGPLIQGLWVTLWLSLLSGILGLALGLVTGLCRVSKNYVLKSLASLYVELIRGTPLLVQIFIFYFFIGTVLNLDRMVAGVGALGIFAGAYIAEIIRAGIQSIPRGQMEAARSLGMTVPQAMRHIILPQAFKRTLPPLAGQFISLIKDSSLVSVIAITDLTKSGREVITSSFATFEVWFTVAALYLIVTSLLSQVVFWMERRLSVSD